jgi:hypothetical protein
MADRKRRVVPQLDWGAPPAATEVTAKKPKAPTTPKADARGRPPKGQGVYVTTTVRLLADDLDYLDDSVRAIKRRGGDRSLTRSEVLRAITAAVRAANIDLRSARDYDSLVTELAKRIVPS